MRGAWRLRGLPGVLCHLRPQAVEKLSCPQSAQLAACSELLSSKASLSFTPSLIPFSASCLLEPTSFPVCPGGWPSPIQRKKGTAAGQWLQWTEQKGVCGSGVRRGRLLARVPGREVEARVPVYVKSRPRPSGPRLFTAPLSCASPNRLFYQVK